MIRSKSLFSVIAMVTALALPAAIQAAETTGNEAVTTFTLDIGLYVVVV